MRVVGIGSRGQDLDGEDKTIFLISSDDASLKSLQFDISLPIKQTSFKICESLSLSLLLDSLNFDTLVWKYSPKTSGKSFVGVLVGKGSLLVVSFISLATLKSALEFLQLGIFSLKYSFFPQ